jgi:hypothetical protein
MNVTVLYSGLRSYGKVVYVFVPLSTLGFLIFASKVLGDFPIGDFQVQTNRLRESLFKH